MKKLLSVIIALIMLVCPLTAFAADGYQNNDVRHVSIHDPSIVKSQDGAYYSVGSHLVMGKSKDLVNWDDMGFSLDGKNYLTTADKSWKDTLKVPLEWCLRYQKARPEEFNESNYQYNCWANDIIYNEAMGKYCLYGSCSVWGKTSSAIWLCVSDNIEGPYEYVDTLIESGITSKARFDKARAEDNNEELLRQKDEIYALDWNYSNIPDLINKGKLDQLTAGKIDNTKFIGLPGYKWVTYDGFYNFWMGGYPNCIDPTAFTDKNGEMWLVYGSYSGGCYLQKLDKKTGLVDYSYMQEKINNGKASGNDDIYYGTQLSKTNDGTEGTGEGPFIVYDSVSGYYYFFLTYGGLAGDGGYNIREYRSKAPDGPYLDKAGNSALDTVNSGLKLDGNYKFSCQPTALLSGGHSSCLVDSDGSIYQAYHTRFVSDGGNGHQMRVHKMLRTADGWAVLMPFEYQGEKDLKAVTKAEVIGKYEFIDSNNMTQHKAAWDSPWSDIVLPTQSISLNADGTITGAKDYSCSATSTNTGSKAVSGTWSLINNTAYCNIRLGSVTYTCVFCYQKDESKSGKTVLTFSGAGSDNSTVWGVQGERYKMPATKVTVKATKLTKLLRGKRAFTAKWKKVSAVSGYQLQYSTSKKFTKKATKTKKLRKTKLTVRKLKKKKKYYIRVRAYKKVNGKTYYSKWSKAKAIKTK